MVDLAAISGTVSGLKAAFDIAKGVQSLKTDTAIRQATADMLDTIIDARGKAMEAQEAQFALLKRVPEVEEEIGQLKAWDGEAERYELQEISAGVFAYVPKPAMQGDEPSHWLCTACYQKRHKSFLQNQGRDTAGRRDHNIYKCPTCKAEARVMWNRAPGKTPDEAG